MIEQVLVNLCVNARDAMPEGGSLIIETENVMLTESYCEDHLWASPGRYVLISVTDTGCGVPRDKLESVFEPFYTTKPAHKGTGLGLSMVYGIVRQHDGIVNVYSEVGKGTTFKVYLPQSERKAEDVGTKIQGVTPLGNETILVVEDDDSVRSLTRIILERAGYTVREAGDGRSAVDRFREDPDGVDLVLLDVVMPGMGGRDAFNAMSAIRPGLKARYERIQQERDQHKLRARQGPRPAQKTLLARRIAARGPPGARRGRRRWRGPSRLMPKQRADLYCGRLPHRLGGCRFNVCGERSSYNSVLTPYGVIPAKAGIQWNSEVCSFASLDPRVRGDGGSAHSFYSGA